MKTDKSGECPYCLHGWVRDVPPDYYDEECNMCNGTGYIRKCIQCNLCTQCLPLDEDTIHRMKRHEQFHREYSVKNLNHGLVEWRVV